MACGGAIAAAGIARAPDGGKARRHAPLTAADLAPPYQPKVPGRGTATTVCRGPTAPLTRPNAALEILPADGTIDEFAARWL